jgi:partner of Y14 and mago
MSDETIIPSTRRPDGTWRKEIRVRAGYTPQDEIGAFETTASRLKSGAKSIPGYHQVEEGKSQAKSEGEKSYKLQKSLKRPNDAQKNNATSVAKQLQNLTVQETNEQNISTGEDDQAKRLRKIKKKLREINELEMKIQSGTVQESDEIRKKIDQRVLLESEVSAIEESLQSK